MSLKNYLSEKEYTYKLKSVVPLGDYEMDIIERLLLPYAPLDISRPRRLMFQTNPFDFPKVHGAELMIVDIKLGLPMSPYQYMEALRKYFPINAIVVRATDDPTEIQQYNLEAMEEVQAEHKDEVSDSLISDSTYGEFEDKEEPAFGNKYNAKLLNYLKAVEEEKPLAKKVDAENSLFKWLDMPKSDVEAEDFNKDVDGQKTGDSSGEKVEPHLERGYVGIRKPYIRKYGGKTVSSGDKK